MRANSATVPKLCAWVSGIKIHSYRLYYSILYYIIMRLGFLNPLQDDSKSGPEISARLAKIVPK